MRANADRRCHYCGEKGATTRDHIVPRARGGRDAAWNVVYSCKACNGDKGMKWPTCECSKCAVAIKLHRERYGIRPGSLLVRKQAPRWTRHLT